MIDKRLCKNNSIVGENGLDFKINQIFPVKLVAL